MVAMVLMMIRKNKGFVPLIGAGIIIVLVVIVSVFFYRYKRRRQRSRILEEVRKRLIPET